jgi:ElaB/YqjD/DUF883 family membrane-anchored ribosome-binding protein
MNQDVEKALETVNRSAEEISADLREKAVELCNSVEAYVRQEPIKAVAIAVGVGLLTGLLVSRR